MRKLFLATVSVTALMAMSGGASAQSTIAEATVNAGPAATSVFDNAALDDGSLRENTIDGSAFDGAEGINHVQQNNGNANTIQAATAVNANVVPTDGVEGTASVTGDTNGNTVDQLGAGGPDPDRSNDITDGAFTDHMGILTVQQNNGDANEIGAATAVQATTDSVGDVSQTASTSGNSADNGGTESINNGIFDDSIRENTIDGDAFDGDMGIVTVQQNNGSANAIGAATAVVGITGDADNVTQTISNGATVDNSDSDSFANTRDNNINSVFNNRNGGVLTLQQNNGDGNVIGAATAVLGDAAPDSTTSVTQSATADSLSLSNVDANDELSDRSNVIDPSFTDLQGIVTVQQNNGDGNAIVAGTAVAGVLGGSGDIDQTASIGGSISNVNADDTESLRDNTIDSSFNGAQGVVTSQQNNGNANIMGVANAVVGDPDPTRSNTVTQAAAAGGLDLSGIDASSDTAERSNLIDPSFTDAAGVITVQQNNGNANALASGNAIAGIMGNTSALSQTASADGSVNDFDIEDLDSVRNNDVTDSFDGASGAITVQQNNGDGNAIGSSFAVAATQTSGGSDSDDVSQTVSASGAIGDSVSGQLNDEGSQRSNDISGSFDGAEGRTTVQQNNGDGNVMTAASAVVAVTGANANLDDYSQSVSADGSISGTESSLSDEGNLQVGSRDNDIWSSFNDGAAGLVNVQQNNGNGNVLSVANGVSVDEGGANGDATEDVTEQTAAANGSISGVTSALIDIFGSSNERTNSITDSFGDGVTDAFEGVLTVQQNNGDNNVMAASTAVAATLGPDDIDDVTNQGAAVTASVDDVTSTQGSFDTNRTNDITNSFLGAQGVVTVQQNNGDDNVMASAIGVVASLNTVNSASNGDVTQSATGTLSTNLVNVTGSPNADSTNLITGSFNDGFAGVGTVLQNNGDGNAIGASFGVAVHDNNGFGQAVSMAVLNGTVSNNVVTVGDPLGVNTPTMTNTISNSFQGAQGAMTIVQNNGHGNVIGSSMVVTANISN